MLYPPVAVLANGRELGELPPGRGTHNTLGHGGLGQLGIGLLHLMLGHWRVTAAQARSLQTFKPLTASRLTDDEVARQVETQQRHGMQCMVVRPVGRVYRNLQHLGVMACEVAAEKTLRPHVMERVGDVCCHDETILETILAASRAPEIDGLTVARQRLQRCRDDLLCLFQ